MEQQYNQDNDIICMVCSCDINCDQEMIKCHHCERALHSVCKPHVDDIWKKLPFTCDSCMTKLELHKTRKFSASELPESVLSKQIEKSIHDFLQSNGTGAGKITVRSFLKDIDQIYQMNTKTYVK